MPTEAVSWSDALTWGLRCGSCRGKVCRWSIGVEYSVPQVVPDYCFRCTAVFTNAGEVADPIIETGSNEESA